MNKKLSKIYKHIYRDGQVKSSSDILKRIAAVSPSLLLLGALPAASQSQVLSDVGLVCNNNQTAPCDLPAIDQANSIQSTTSFGGTYNSRPFVGQQTFGFSYQDIDMECDGDDEFRLWAGGVARELNYTNGDPLGNYVFQGGVDFTNLSSGAAFGFDVTYSSPGGAIYGFPAVLDGANSASVSASDTFQGGVNIFAELNNSQSGTFLGNDIAGSAGPLSIGSTGFVPVEFDSGGNIHYGWVEVAINGVGIAEVLNTAFNPVPGDPALASNDACAIADTAIPTAGEWGLISLGLLLLSFGTTMIIRKESTLATDQGNISLGFGKPLFNGDLFKKSLLIALGVGLMLSIGSVAIFGTLTLTDIIGGALATPILAYWLHLVGMYKNEEI